MRRIRTPIRFLSVILCVCMVLTLMPVSAADNRMVNNWDTDGDGTLEILAIGNSFAVDALEFAWQIANDLGIEEIALGILYIGGCTLETHAANAAGDLAKYTYYFNDNGTWTSTSKYKISTALSDRDWDFISMQQASGSSGVQSTYNEDLTNLVFYVRERSSAKLVWHMTWAYQQNSTHSSFSNYDSDQMTMYNAIVSVTQNKIVGNSNFDLIVPNGTAVQNSRTSVLGDTTTRDGYHMSYDYGRYLTGLMFVKTITGLSVDHVTYRPDGVSELQRNIAVESVNNAAMTPFAVTESAYKVEELTDAYVQLELELNIGAYWKSTDSTRFNVLITNASNSKYYCATARFSKDELPIGSVIVVAEGWEYRPDGWVTDAKQASRPDATTQPYVTVTEEWWGDYTLRGFNISMVNNTSLEDYTPDDIREVFKIYVPVHEHSYAATVTPPSCTAGGYTTYTCSICGDSYVGDLVEPFPHGYKKIVTAPTCTTKGYTTYTCMGCGDSYVGDEVSASGHAYECVVNEPGCTEDGVRTYTCKVCGDSYTESISAIGHSYESSVTDPTCMTDGYTTYTCTLCSDSYVGDIVTASGHNYESVVTAPTYNADGYTTHTCTVCGHSYVDSIVSATGFTLAGANTVLGGVLDMNFFINPSDLNGTDYYAEITLYTETDTVTTTVPYAQWGVRSNYLVVTQKGLAARQMADKIEVVIYNGDGTQASFMWSDSIRSYVMRILEDQNDETKTMLVDMLNYGAAAQNFFEYNMDDLANNLLSDTQKAYATETVTCTDQSVKGEGYFGSSLVLRDRILMTVYFSNITPDMYAVVSFTDHKGVAHETRVEGSAFSKYNNTTYGVVVDELVVADGDALVTVTVYDAEGNVVASASDSVNSYAARQMGKDALYEMVAKFTNSAYAHFH